MTGYEYGRNDPVGMMIATFWISPWGFTDLPGTAFLPKIYIRYHQIQPLYTKMSNMFEGNASNLGTP